MPGSPTLARGLVLRRVDRDSQRRLACLLGQNDARHGESRATALRGYPRRRPAEPGPRAGHRRGIPPALRDTGRDRPAEPGSDAARVGRARSPTMLGSTPGVRGRTGSDGKQPPRPARQPAEPGPPSAGTPAEDRPSSSLPAAEPLPDGIPPPMPEPIPRIESVHIEGFRSLKDVTLRPNPGITVLIGPNGAGKSNLFRFFDLLHSMLPLRRLGIFVGLEGGASHQLFHGSQRTPRMKGEIGVRTGAGLNEYAFALARGNENRFHFTEERYRFSGSGSGADAEWRHLRNGDGEARLLIAAQEAEDNGHRQAARAITDFFDEITPFQFHDTSKESPFKNHCHVTDSFRLWPNGGNLAAVLHRMQREDARRYDELCGQISWILPAFERFAMKEENDYVILRWRARNSGQIMGAHLTSDGSLRFFALMTLLSLPGAQLPNVILLDEPELGLHPTAIALVSGMIRSMATRRQVVIATQSPLLVDEFDLDEVRVLDLNDGQTHLRTLDPGQYQEWLEDYSTGELWRKNLLGGGP